MLKVLFLIPNLKHGGAEKVLVNLVNNLDMEKYRITVQTIFDVGTLSDKLSPNVRYLPGMKRQFRGNSHILKLASPKMLYKVFVREKYDVIVSYLEGITSRILAGCPDPEIKKICWIHTEITKPEDLARGFRSVAEARCCYGQYDRIIGVSQQVREQFIKNLGADVPSLVLFNTNESGKIRIQAQEETADPEFCSGGPQVCAIGRVNSVKGFDRLLNAHRRLLAEGVHHRICILGTGEDSLKLKQIAEQYGVEDSFRLLGFRENPYPYLAGSDFFVCSSRREGFSTAVTEALILGTPVVSTDCSGARELLGNHNEYGLVVENSEEGIYQGMKQFLSDPALLAQYRKKAKERGEVFSKGETVRAVEELLDSL